MATDYEVVSSIDDQPVFDARTVRARPLVRHGRRSAYREAISLASSEPMAGDHETFYVRRMA